MTTTPSLEARARELLAAHAVKEHGPFDTLVCAECAVAAISAALSEADKLREALEIIAGRRAPYDLLIMNVEVATQALEATRHD